MTTALAAALLMSAAASAGGTCGEWTITPNPVFQGQDVLPRAIMTFAPDNAVGLQNVQPGGQQHLARMVWDGATWTVASTDPMNFPGSWEMRAAAGLAPDDLWATGIMLTSSGNQSAPFLAHFDGAEWTEHEATILPGGSGIRNAEAQAITIIAPDDIWVAGIATGSSGIVCHWDGSNLEEVGPLPVVYDRWRHLHAIDAAGSDEVWTVGEGRNIGGNFHILAYHFDGSQWRTALDWTPLPGQNVLSEELADVVAVGPGDAWAVGKKLVMDGTATRTASLYLRWNGSGWTEVAGPDIGPITNAAASGPDDIWVSVGFGEYLGALAHYDGTAWTAQSSAPIPRATHIGLAVLAAGAGCDAWAIGSWGIYNGAGGWTELHSLMEHLETGSPSIPGDVNGDGVVDVLDLLEVLANWGPCPACPADLNGDGIVDVLDLLEVLGNWG